MVELKLNADSGISKQAVLRNCLLYTFLSQRCVSIGSSIAGVFREVSPPGMCVGRTLWWKENQRLAT